MNSELDEFLDRMDKKVKEMERKKILLRDIAVNHFIINGPVRIVVQRHQFLLGSNLEPIK